MTVTEGASDLCDSATLPAAIIESFRLDGAVLLKGYFRDWVEPLRAGIERNLAELTYAANRQRVPVITQR